MIQKWLICVNFDENKYKAGDKSFEFKPQVGDWRTCLKTGELTPLLNMYKLVADFFIPE